MLQFLRHRSNEPEIIDDFDYQGTDLPKTFKTIERINAFLGGNRVLVNGVQKIVKQLPESGKPSFHLLDLGTGSGDGLRDIVQWARKKEVKIQCTGIDANPHIIAFAQSKTAPNQPIQYQCQDIFNPSFSYQGYDIVTCNLFLHHFSTAEIISIIEKAKNSKVKAILINDLHRHWLAYYGFMLICLLTRATWTARYDGLLSIKKGFLRKELEAFLTQIKGLQYKIQWKWAFRFQCIVFFEESNIL